MLRLIHTADWQLGKPYGRFDSDVRAALSEARFDAIDAIGKAAAEHEVRHVLVAGDVFDTEGPEDRVIVQAVSRMQRYACTWWLLPGNHDFARNSGLWDRVRAKGAANVRVLAEPVPCELEPGQWLLRDCQEFCAGGRLPSLDDEALTEDYGELTFGLT
ncbi:DNA repair exonuclease SbcCD nuclease subunit, partial [Sphingomonas aquatilis]